MVSQSGPCERASPSKYFRKVLRRRNGESPLSTRSYGTSPPAIHHFQAGNEWKDLSCHWLIYWATIGNKQKAADPLRSTVMAIMRTIGKSIGTRPAEGTLISCGESSMGARAESHQSSSAVSPIATCSGCSGGAAFAADGRADSESRRGFRQ